eukprot:scaffold9420_cov63-Isochrysis_galbana.AAC.1
MPQPASPHCTAMAVHCCLCQTHAATGRLTTEQPNLQGLPHALTFPRPQKYIFPSAGSLHDEQAAAVLPFTLPRGARVCIALPSGAGGKGYAGGEGHAGGGGGAAGSEAHSGRAHTAAHGGVVNDGSARGGGASGGGAIGSPSERMSPWVSGSGLAEALVMRSWPSADAPRLRIDGGDSPLADWWAAQGHTEYTGAHGACVQAIQVRLVGSSAHGG